MAASTNFRRDQWTMLLATMFCYLFFYTGRHNFGWAATEMAADLGISYAMIGWISSAMLFGYAFGQFVNGNLADRYSPRNMIVLGAVLSVGANVAISFGTTYTYILVLWALNGYFQSMAWAPGSRLISNWWERQERGKAFGLYTMAAGSSSVVTFLLSILILQNGIAWPYLFRLPVLFLLFAAIVFLLVARSKPSQKGYPDLYPDLPNQPTISSMERYRVVLKNKRFLLTSLSLGFESMARYGLLVWVPVHFLGTVSADGAESLWGSLLLPVGMALGAFSFGILSDKVFYGNRVRSIGMGMLLAAGTMLAIYWTPSENWQLGAVLMFLAGFFVYGPQANFWPLSPEIVGEKFVGTGVGIMNTSAYLFAAMGEPILGNIIDRSGSSTPVFLALAVICFLSAGTIQLSSYAPRPVVHTEIK